MPTLKQLTCHIERGPNNTSLREYSTSYGDGFVETFVGVPDQVEPFSIHLTSDGYVAPGLAMFVFMDGIPQCNRNRRDLVMPTSATDPSRSEIDFRVRQKEEKIDTGRWLGRQWTFAALNTAAADASPAMTEDITNNIGTIEVVVLRCKGGNDVSSGAYTVPERRKVKFKDTKEQRNGDQSTFSHPRGLDAIDDRGLDGTTEDFESSFGDTMIQVFDDDKIFGLDGALDEALRKGQEWRKQMGMEPLVIPETKLSSNLRNWNAGANLTSGAWKPSDESQQQIHTAWTGYGNQADPAVEPQPDPNNPGMLTNGDIDFHYRTPKVDEAALDGAGRRGSEASPGGIVINQYLNSGQGDDALAGINDAFQRHGLRANSPVGSAAGSVRGRSNAPRASTSEAPVQPSYMYGGVPPVTQTYYPPATYSTWQGTIPVTYAPVSAPAYPTATYAPQNYGTGYQTGTYQPGLYSSWYSQQAPPAESNEVAWQKTASFMPGAPGLSKPKPYEQKANGSRQPSGGSQVQDSSSKRAKGTNSVKGDDAQGNNQAWGLGDDPWGTQNNTGANDAPADGNNDAGGQDTLDWGITGNDDNQNAAVAEEINANSNEDPPWDNGEQNDTSGDLDWGNSPDNNGNNNTGNSNNDMSWGNDTNQVTTHREASAPEPAVAASASKSSKERSSSSSSNAPRSASRTPSNPSKPVIKSYWDPQTRNSTALTPKDISTHSKNRRRTQLLPPEPLAPIPATHPNKENLSHQVQAGEAVIYHHRSGRPVYIDTFKDPYAVFVFKYRSFDCLEKILGKDMKPEAKTAKEKEAGRKKLMEMSKEELVQMLARAKARLDYGTDSSFSPSEEEQESSASAGKSVESRKPRSEPKKAEEKKEEKQNDKVFIHEGKGTYKAGEKKTSSKKDGGGSNTGVQLDWGNPAPTKADDKKIEKKEKKKKPAGEPTW